MILGDKGYVSKQLHRELLETENTCLLATRRSNQKQQYPEDFRKLQVRLRRRIETTLIPTQQFLGCYTSARGFPESSYSLNFISYYFIATECANDLQKSYYIGIKGQENKIKLRGNL